VEEEVVGKAGKGRRCTSSTRRILAALP